MRMSVTFRHKGIGTKVVTKYCKMIRPICWNLQRIGKYFGRNLVFKETGKLAIREN